MSGGRSMKHSTSGIKPNGTSDRLSPPTLRPGEDFFRRTASPSSEERFVPSAGCRPQGSRNPQGRARRAREAITSPEVRILPGTSGTPVPPGFSPQSEGGFGQERTPTRDEPSVRGFSRSPAPASSTPSRPPEPTRGAGEEAREFPMGRNPAPARRIFPALRGGRNATGLSANSPLSRWHTNRPSSRNRENSLRPTTVRAQHPRGTRTHPWMPAENLRS